LFDPVPDQVNVGSCDPAVDEVGERLEHLGPVTIVEFWGRLPVHTLPPKGRELCKNKEDGILD